MERGVFALAPPPAPTFSKTASCFGRLLSILRIGLVLLAFLQPGLHLGEGSAAQGSACDTTMLECAAIEARTVVIVALTDDLATTHDDTAVAVVERRFGGLLEAKREVVVRLHFVVSFKLLGDFVGEGGLSVRVTCLIGGQKVVGKVNSESFVAVRQLFVCSIYE